MTKPYYPNPQAMRQALGDRLRRFAADHPGTQLADLQRQFAYDRLLSRAFQAQPDRWVLKGATAMLARLHGLARHTRDLDLYSRHGDLAEAEAALRTAVSVDLGDYFQFILSPGREFAEGPGAVRIPLVAYLGATVFASFHIDLVAGITMTGAPDEVPPLVPGELPGLIRTPYRVYPIADHVADKVCAMLERHPRLTGTAAESTRYRDLVDLTVFAHTADPEANDLRRALIAEAARRRLRLPRNLSAPSGTGWRSGYVRAARDAPGVAERDLDAALETVQRFVDPVLDGTAAGRWLPDNLCWTTASGPWKEQSGT